jgi:hypothetical protein
MELTSKFFIKSNRAEYIDEKPIKIFLKEAIKLDSTFQKCPKLYSGPTHQNHRVEACKQNV